MEKERIVFLDYIRMAACLMVMLVHACEQYYGVMDAGTAGPTSFLANETDRLWVSVLDGFSRMCVPLFMMVSAYLLAPMAEGLGAGTFYRKRLLRVGPPTLVFLVLYAVLPLLWGGLSARAAGHDLAFLPLTFPAYGGHLWFMYPLIGLYLFIPVISPWLRTASPREERFFLALWAVSLCLPYLRRYFGDVWGGCFWNRFGLLYYFSGFLGYLILAHYIRVHLQWGRTRRLVAGAACLLTGAAATILSFYLQAVPGQTHPTPVLELGWDMCCLNVALETAGAFLLLSCITAPSRLVTGISRLSFGIYLMHMFWLILWTAVLKPLLPTLPGILCITLATFLCATLATWLLSLLPGSRWWLGVDKR